MAVTKFVFTSAGLMRHAGEPWKLGALALLQSELDTLKCWNLNKVTILCKVWTSVVNGTMTAVRYAPSRVGADRCRPMSL